MAKMSDDQLLSQLEAFERQATGFIGGEIAAEQQRAMDYYLGKPFGTEEEGRSQVISSDVWDVVEGLTPMVLKPFVASDDVVRFQPQNAEDEEAAEQESDYINYIVTQKNDVFEQLVAWVKAGLLLKNGVAKYWWEKSRRTEIERYYGLSAEAMAMLAQQPGVEIAEHTENQTVEQVPQPDGSVVEVPVSVHDVTLRITHEQGEARYAVIPPEEFLISRDAASVNPKNARFVEHRKIVTLSELREMGYDVDDDVPDQDSEDPSMHELYLSRREGDEERMGDEGEDPSLREVVLRESYVRVDFDGDGIAELRKICRVGRKILSNEETEEIPFVAWTPYQQPFKFYGRSPADETCEIQLIKSTVLRQTLDNIYRINNNRVYVGPGVNIDDLVDNQIAGIVRYEGSSPLDHVVKPAETTPIGQITMPMVEYFDSAKENRTGFTRYNQGTDSDSLNKTATGVRMITEAGNQRVEIISRAFAETGLKQLMLGIHGLCRRHADKAEMIRLRGKWVEIDPRSWKTRYDMSVQVGLGTADKQMQMMGAQMLLAEQKELAAVGIVKPDNFLHAAHKLVEAVGYKNPEAWFSAPEEQAPPDPTQDPQFILEATDRQHKEQELKIKAAEVGLKAEELKMRQATEMARLHQEREQKQFEMRSKAAEFEHKSALDKANLGMQADQSMYQRQQDAMAAQKEEEGPSEEIAEIKDGQEQTIKALEQVGTVLNSAVEALQKILEQQSKPVKVKKLPDGSWTRE